ncbi:MAG TPA: glycine betaine ABC transporter substrate-binding protein [Terriglobales bacterium]|jgi:glycine betaine/choline ABC-type transport system substrate-binding protein
METAILSGLSSRAEQPNREAKQLRSRGTLCFLVTTTFACLLLALSCSPRQSDRIVVGSKNFTEQLILGELMAQQIENKTHLPVDRRFFLAGTYITHQAVLAGRIDVYPEYTGTALTAILKQDPKGTRQQVFERVKAAYAQRFDLVVGQPLGFNDTFSIQIRGEDARRLGLKTISQAAPYTPQWRPGFGYEFMERPDGYKGWVAAYGLRFAAPPRIMDLGLLTRALRDKQLDLIAGNSTDGLVPALDLAVLEDDRNYFPPYEAVPVIRAKVLQRHPEVKTALDELAGKISDDDMRKLNYAVDGQHRTSQDVVREFLKSKGL